MRIAYVVHDLGDAAVARRLRMLRQGGATVTLLGFRRATRPPEQVEGLRPLDLGGTYDGRFAQRLMAVASACVRSGFGVGGIGAACADVDVVLARNLEALAVGALLRRRFAPSARLAYEALDIHRLMTANGASGQVMRGAERALLQRCDLLLTSSPAFVREHFAKAHPVLPAVHLEENRVLSSESPDVALPQPPSGAPWRIGWFGIIRCARSLDLLANLVRRRAGQVEVIIRGRPARDAVPDFDAIVARTPGLSFHGPYDRAADLARIYGEVHLTWACDFFEAGANSDWLLPNRLYEGGLLNAVPIAPGWTETGRWLKARGAGLLLNEPLQESLVTALGDLDEAGYAALRQASTAIPRADLKADDAACRALVRALAGPGETARSTPASLPLSYEASSP